MFEERKVNPKQRELYLEKGYWTNQTLLDCWEQTLSQYPDREYVADDRGYRYTYREMDEAAGRVASISDLLGSVLRTLSPISSPSGASLP